MTDFENLKNSLTKYEQQHLLQFWEQLSEAGKRELLDDIRDTNIAEVCSFFKRAVESLEEGQQKLDDRMKPIPPEAFGSVTRTRADVLKSYYEEGLRLISEGHVGVLLLAGGQGTRLGVPYPKGMFSVGLPSQKSLFQIQAERIRRLQELAFRQTGKRNYITWYIMTSEHTMEPTHDFLCTNNYFGLNKNNIVLFEQGMLPCFTLEGKIIMETTSRIAKSPDGNGGLYRALRDRKILDDIKNRGIKYLHAHSVDNILTKVADPVFIGYCVSKGAECGAKVVEKAFPTEALGVVCNVDEKYQVVEYSEITLRTAELRNPDGKLTFSAGNICNHFFSAEFLERVVKKDEANLQLHVAKKKIPHINEKGVLCRPDKPNGIKMEKFVFDVFQFTEKLVVWEVLREEEFSALKNADTAEKDTATTARRDIYALHRKFIKRAGGKVLPGDSEIICEISPCISYAGEDLEGLVAGKSFKTPVLLEAPDEGKLTNGSSASSGATNGSICANGITNGTKKIH